MTGGTSGSGTPDEIPGGTTPFPNRLLDEAMPGLRDTEWRLLCVIVRQTSGWRSANGGRKERDWLTHSQLKARTGRAGAAVSKAISGLVARGLVEVEDRSGRTFTSANERRLAYTRLYYRLRMQAGEEAAGTSQEAPAPVAVASSQSGIEKAKTTKANGTKEEIAQESTESENGRRAPSLAGTATTEETPAGLAPAVSPGPQGDAAAVAERYHELYRRRFGRMPPPPSEAVWEQLARRLELYGADELLRWLPAFFASRFGYVRRRGHSLGSYLDTVAILRAAHRSLPTDVPDAVSKTAPVPPLPEGNRDGETTVETSI